MVVFFIFQAGWELDHIRHTILSGKRPFLDYCKLVIFIFYNLFVHRKYLYIAATKKGNI